MGIALGPLVVLGPLLNGSWDLWAQTLLIAAAAALAAAWFCLRPERGRAPVPWLWLWAVGLGVWGGLSAYAGPLAAYAAPAWRVWLAGLGIMLAVAALPESERRRLDLAVRAAAWIMALLAVYQHFGLGLQRPPSSLLNQNIFAGALLLLIPLAHEQRDWPLCALLLVCLAW
ncbi:MAG: hypothetical protein PHF00_03675, partial [Elusimicrobia bacterium]|nr:hypothetical protein [Elusimicrobiota bacterium]